MSLGLRGVLASMKRVQLSAYGMVGFGMSRAQDKTITTGSSDSAQPNEDIGYNVGGAFGVVADAFLLPNVALRLSTPLIGLTYTTSKNIDRTSFASDIGTVTTPTSSITGGLRLSPSLEVRILF